MRLPASIATPSGDGERCGVEAKRGGSAALSLTRRGAATGVGASRT